jgi:deazaflavin-dependent oxidoreductase (nitroreductase family)
MVAANETSDPATASAVAAMGSATNEAGLAAREQGTGEWGEGLQYPASVTAALPALHAAFNSANKYVGVPALKMGLGRYISNPLTGYLMILRTRGRKSGEMRDAPLGYTILGEYVYCMAGFGRRAHWFQNVLADPNVEVILPSRAFGGVAEEVTDDDERIRVVAPLMRSMGAIAGMMGMGNPWRDSPDAIAGKCEGMPLVRIKATGIAAGPEDPGGRYWVVPIAAGILLATWWLRRRRCDKG